MTKLANPKRNIKNVSHSRIISIISLPFGLALTLSIFWGLIISKATFLLIIICTIMLSILGFILFFWSKHKAAVYRKQLEENRLKITKIKLLMQTFLSALFRLQGLANALLTILFGFIMFWNSIGPFNAHTAYEIMEEKADENVSFSSLKYLFEREDTPEPSNPPEESTNSTDSTDEPISSAAKATDEPIGSTSAEATDEEIGNASAKATDEPKRDDFPAPTDDGNAPEAPGTEAIGEPADPTPATTPELFTLGSYDYSPLFLFGSYEFGDTITRQDLENMRSLYNAFMESKEYTNMLNIPEEAHGDYLDILQQIGEFDEWTKSNSAITTSEDLYQNTLNRLFCYGQNNNTKNLEQAAISAEGAVEKEQIAVSGSYNNYINYTKTGAVTFFCVAGSEQPEYDSGTAVDVLFRAAKLLYKPSANLLNIEPGERYYSLCSAYIVSQEVFSGSTSECNYAVDIAYYHMKICSDLVDYIEDREFRDEICREALGVHTEYRRRVENSDKSLYQDFEKDAEKILNKLEALLGYNATVTTDDQALPE